MLITNFSSGELSPWLNGRTDIQQYFQSAQLLKNFDVIPTGGIRRRTGTKRLGKLNGECRLIPFILDKENSFILEFTEEKIYFWKNGEKLMADGEQVVLPTGYTLAEVNEIQYAQDYDRMIFVQKNHAPYELKYNYADRTFTGGEMTFTFYPDVELDDDFDYVKVQSNDEGLPEAEFDGQYCIWHGKLWQYSEDKDEWIVDTRTTDPEIDDKLFTTETKYPGCISFFNNRLYLGSTLSARQKVWASATPDTESTRYNNFATFKKYVTVQKIVKDADIHIFTGNILLSDVTNDTTTITGLSQDMTESLAKEPTDYYLTNTGFIPIGARVIEITRDSITVDKAASISEDAHAIVFTISLWKNSNSASADDYELTVLSTNVTTSDCSFNFELASDQNDAIRFIGANRYLVIGTESSVWAAPGGISALNIAVDMNGRYGSDEIQGHCVDTAMIFFAQGKCGIREYYYNTQTEAFQTNNIAILAEQMLTESPAVDFDFVTNPYNRLLITREDGKVVTMLYDKTNGVMAWYRIEHGANKIVSCCTTRGSLQNDLIYFVVKEEDGENTEYYLELLDSNNEVFLDSWLDFNHYTDQKYQDNAVIYSPVKDKTILLSEYNELSEEDKATAISSLEETDDDPLYIGYMFESKIKSMPVMADTPDRKKRITNLIFRFIDSYMPTLETTDLPDEDFIDVEEPFTGIKSLDYPGITDREVTFTMTISKPNKCNILAVNANISV